MSGHFETDFQAVVDSKFGEAAVPRIKVRQKGGTVTTVSASETVLAVSEIRRMRERKFGVAQGQTWQARFTHEDLALLALDLPGCWASLEMGFETEDEWELLAQGRIHRAVADTEMTVVIDVEDSIMDALGYSIPRDMFFQSVGWASNLTVVSKDSDSSDFDNDWDGTGSSNGAEAVIPSLFADETFRVVFTGATIYKIVFEDDSEETGLDIGNEEVFGNLANPTADLLKLYPAGWDQAGGAYTAGDEWVFYTSAPRSATQLCPVGMARHLIEDVGGIIAWDVITNTEYSTPVYDETNWDDGVAFTSADEIGGFWAKGSNLTEMIQSAMMLIHGSIFPSPTGQVDMYYLHEATGIVDTFNGEPGGGDIHIISGEVNDSLEDTYNRVSLSYLALGTGTASSVAAVDPDTPYQEGPPLDADCKWRVKASTAASFVSTGVSRFSRSRRTISMATTLAKAGTKIDEIISITDPILGLAQDANGVTEVAIDVMAQRAAVVAYRDPVAVETYARV